MTISVGEHTTCRPAAVLSTEQTRIQPVSNEGWEEEEVMSEVFTFPITKGNFDSKEAAQAAMELKKKELERAHSKGSSGNEEVSEEKGEWSYYFEFVTPQ